MPRNVRNFWIEGEIDGRKEKLSGGPVSKDGGFTLDIFIRDDGEVKKAVSIFGRVEHGGKIVLSVDAEMDFFQPGNPDGVNSFPGEVLTIKTER